jgi:hypothetical protein
MAPVVENRTAIVGVVRSMAAADADGEQVELDLEVESTEPVEGYPDLVTQHVGEDGSLTVVARKDELPEGDLTGWRVRGPVALAGPGVVRLVTYGPDEAEFTPPE